LILAEQQTILPFVIRCFIDETKRKELYRCIKKVIDPLKVLHMLIPSTEGYCYLLKHIYMCDDVVFFLKKIPLQKCTL